MALKVGNPTDRHVGSRVRMRRLMLDMSQERLGDALGLTFQQVQKYEKGTNRIGSSRLVQIANILRVPVPFFFEGRIDADEFLATTEGVRLAQAFARIKNLAIKRDLVALIQRLANQEHKAS
jgi:transcriptional regulator with XRE-family HTH domain